METVKLSKKIRGAIEEGLKNHVSECCSDGEYYDIVDDLEFEITKLCHDCRADAFSESLKIIEGCNNE